MWFPGHTNIKGNETYDHQAKNATKTLEINQIQESTYDDKKKKKEITYNK